jgi:adenylate cyclase class IV
MKNKSMVNLELEYRFYDYYKPTIIEILIKNGGLKIHDPIVMELTVFNAPTYLRVRKEYNKVLLTSKSYNGTFAVENEIEVADYNETIERMKTSGYSIKYDHMKIREKYQYKNTEIVFDMYPGLPEYMEIESKTLIELNEVCSLLNLDISNHKWKHLNQWFTEIYGILKSPKNLTFGNLEEILKPLIKKNYDFFEYINTLQKNIFKS